MNRRILHAFSLATLLVVGCSSTPELTDSGPPRYLPQVNDQRQASAVMEKVLEGDRVRYFVDEYYFGLSLIDLFHREMELHAPRLPERRQVDVTEIEVSVTAVEGNRLTGQGDDMLGREKVELDPAKIVLDENAAEEVRVRVAYRIDDRYYEDLLTANVKGGEEARHLALDLYLDMITQIIERLV